MGPESEYEILRDIRYDLVEDVCFIDSRVKEGGPVDESWVIDLKKNLAILKKYPTVSRLDEFSKLERIINGALVYAVEEKIDMEEYNDDIISNYGPVLEEVRNLSIEVRPPIDENERKKVLSLAIELDDGINILKEDIKIHGEGNSEIREKLWFDIYKTHNTALSGILKKMKSSVSGMGYEKVLVDAAEILNTYSKEKLLAYENISKTISSPEILNKVNSIIKEEYKFTKEELERPKFLKNLRADLKIAHREAGRLKEIVEAVEAAKPIPVLNTAVLNTELPLSGPSVMAFPKHIKNLKILENLNEQLPYQIGLNRPANDSSKTLYDIVRTVEKILFSDINQAMEGLTEEDRKFLSTSYDLKNLIENIPGDSLFDGTQKDIIKNYSFELERFIRRKIDVYY